MYVTSKQMLECAQDGGYAIGAFNVENAEMVWAVIAAAEESHAPVILQTTTSTLRYFPPSYFAALVCKAGEHATVPVALHLDHGASYELAEQCLNEGYSSIMIDGSALPFEENVTLSERVSKLTKKYHATVEAELGVIGGKEDDTVAEGSSYTDPRQAADFIQRSGVDSLAVAIGTAHGFYKTTPVLDLDRISLIRKKVTIPLVLHGASGLPDETVSHAASLGMAKVNFATELRNEYTQAVRSYLLDNPSVIDPKKYGVLAREAVKKLVMHKIKVCGCDGKAN